MVNFIGRATKESWVMFMRQATSDEIASSVNTLWDKVKHCLLNGMIGRWMTDNSKSFLGQEVEQLAEHLAERRGFNVPNAKNELPVAKRHWGVIERMVRSSLAQPDGDLPQCIWPWAA